MGQPSDPAQPQMQEDSDAMTDVVADVAMRAGYRHAGPEYDELLDTDGRIRGQWDELTAGLTLREPEILARYRGRLRTLIDNHGITYNPVDLPAGTSAHWDVDGVPLVLAADDWAELERGLLQRSRLFDALLADLYGDLRTVREGMVPPRLVFGHSGYVRAAHGLTLPGPHQLFSHAVDVARGPDGRFRVLRDLTQAPSGVGYAMVDRRVVARAMPDLYQTSSPRPLSPFAQAMRLALRDVAPVGAEDPVVVVLSPGARSETAFDQAYIAGTLGFPLVTSADLTVREGRVWMRSLGSLTPVDVILRRVDATYTDPLDLRPDSQLGVVGLVEVLRRGGVTVVNTLGSGVLENPALATLLPSLCRALLDEDLLLDAVPAHWGGTEQGLSAIVARFPDLVLKSAVTSKSVVVATLEASEREDLFARVRAEPERWVGCEHAEFSHAPSLSGPGPGTEITAAPVGVRLFTVAQRVGFTPMAGGLAEVPGSGDPSRVLVKDVWVRAPSVAVTADSAPATEPLPDFAVPAVDVVTSPRVLGDLYWIGRYSERAEDSARLLIAVRERYQDYRFRPWLEGSGCLPVLLATLTTTAPAKTFAVTESAEQPGSTRIDEYRAATAEFRSLTVDADRLGSLAQSFAGLDQAARSVRDQLSADTWSVLADVQRALDALGEEPDDDGALLGVTQSAVLGGMLALSGLGAESMVRDLGWHVMDIGKRIERALALSALLSATLTEVRDEATERALIECVLVASESAVTFRRRHRRVVRLAAVAQLLLFDVTNPRSLAYVLDRIRDNLRALPDSSGASQPELIVEELLARLRRADPVELETASDGTRSELADLLTAIHGGLSELSEVLLHGPLSLPGGTRPLWGGAENRIPT